MSGAGDGPLGLVVNVVQPNHWKGLCTALGENLNTADARVPVTDLRVRFAVAGYPQ
jgi:hypothetical protein